MESLLASSSTKPSKSQIGLFAVGTSPLPIRKRHCKRANHSFRQICQSAEDTNQSGAEIQNQQPLRDDFRDEPLGRQMPVYESDNMWDYKPAWCQPWTILSTGTGFVSIVYQLSGHSKIITGIAGVPVAAWWLVFLVLVPASFKEYVQTQKSHQQSQ